MRHSGPGPSRYLLISLVVDPTDPRGCNEWVYVSNGCVGGLPEPVRVWDWHIRDKPELGCSVPRPLAQCM